MNTATLLLAAWTLVGAPDGDTLRLRQADTEVRVRLAEIDAPEKAQPWSRAATRHVLALCSGREVRLAPVDTDRYGRTVAHVWCGQVHLNWAQVAAGHAWCYRRYLKSPGECLSLEDTARRERRGLWSDEDPTAPWDWRRAHSTGRKPSTER
ncbi:MAG: hypothetical protein RI936_379 [Pseudomonadota bacterium]